MSTEDAIHAIAKGLEAWSLQSLLGATILASYAILALVAGRAYLDSLKGYLTLRVATELWETAADVAVDLLLFFVVLVGLFVTNNDIMADIKVALPWVPIAFVLLAVALVLRACHGGRRVRSGAWWLSLAAIAVACASNWFGFTFVMEAAGHEYLELHPGATVWTTLASMRSDLNPDLTMRTFLWAGPALMLVFAWAVVAGVAQTLRWSAGQAAPSTERGRGDG